MVSPTSAIATAETQKTIAMAISVAHRAGRAHARPLRAAAASSHAPRSVTGTETSAMRAGFGFRSNTNSISNASTHVARSSATEMSGDNVDRTSGVQAHIAAMMTTDHATR